MVCSRLRASFAVLHVFGGHAGWWQAAQSGAAQQFLDRSGDQLRVGAQLGRLIGVIQQQHQRQVDVVGGGLMAGDQQGAAHRGELVLGQPVGVVPGGYERADQVIGGLGSLHFDQRAEVAVQLGHGRHDLAGIALPVSDNGVRPGMELAEVPGGHAEHLADHLGRQRQREGCHQVRRLGPAGHRVDQLVDDARHPRPQSLDPAGGERAGDQLA